MSDFLEGAHSKPRSDNPDVVEVPIGIHVVALPSGVARRLVDVDIGDVRLYGTRVWLNRKDHQLIVHMGDIDDSTQE